MRGAFAALVVLLVTAVPASAAPGFTPAFRTAGAGGQSAMAPDGTVVFPTFAIVNAEPRLGAQVRPPGGPLGDVQLLSTSGATLAGGMALAVGGDGRFVATWIENGDVEVATLMPGATSFTPTATLTDDTADGANVQVDGAGNAYVVWSTRDDDAGANTRTARVRLTKLPAGGGAPSTSLVDQNQTTFATNPILTVAFAVNNAGDAVFVKTRGTTNATTLAYTIDYTGWTQPAGGSPTAPTTLTQTSANDGTGTNDPGEARLDSLNLNINNGGEIMASWYRGANPFSNTTVDVVNGTVAGGFGAIEHPVPGDTLARTTVTSLLDATGRTTVAVLRTVGGKDRAQAFTRPRGGPFGTEQTPVPTGDNQYTSALAGDPSGRVMLVFPSYSGAVSTIITSVAEPGQPFTTGSPLASGLLDLQRAIPVFGASGDGVLVWQYDENGAPVTDAAGYDVSPPQLRNLVMPTAGTAGSPLDFSVQPLDIWGPVTTSWNFDGVASDGASQSHVFGDAGDKAVSVTATDAFGHSSSSNGTVAVAPVPSAPIACCAPPPDTKPPLVSKFAVSPFVFALGPKATPLVAKIVRGTKFKFSLSEPGAVAITIARELPGKRIGNRCVAPTKKLRTKKNCKRYKNVGTLKRSGVAGANSVAFSGRLGRKALALGRYRATIVATDAAGNKSIARTAPFRVVKFR